MVTKGMLHTVGFHMIFWLCVVFAVAYWNQNEYIATPRVSTVEVLD